MFVRNLSNPDVMKTVDSLVSKADRVKYDIGNVELGLYCVASEGMKK